VFRERDAVLASEGDAHKARQAAREAKISELDVQLAHIQSEERQIAGELAEADMLVKRAEARAKRAEIEVRNAMAQQSQVATVPGAAAPKGPGA
jgi:chromosome segregation ATPase